MPRQRWKSRTIFLFAAIGSAVGLGNIWRFPYLTYKYGGGAFLIPYLIALFIIGIPIMILELGIGQKIQKGAIATFGKINRRLTGIGLTRIIDALLLLKERLREHNEATTDLLELLQRIEDEYSQIPLAARLLPRRGVT